MIFNIRKAITADIFEMTELYKNTVLSVNRKDYSAEEVEDWASCGDNMPHWRELFSEQQYFIAENDRNIIVGFASVNDEGYMHTLFVHKDFQHQGIATLLYQTIEKFAYERGAMQITSEVSITAKPFFEKQGFVVDEEQRRKANKLCLTNYKMSKQLGDISYVKQKIDGHPQSKQIEIKRINDNKKQFLDLLLLADEQESMIDRYLEQSELFALYDGGLRTICVVTAVEDSICELKNIATYKEYQGQGYGSFLINYLFDYYKGKYKMMIVGTGNVPSALSFYKNCGFELSHRIENFFTDNYDHIMIEDGIQLIDMVYLKRELL